MSEKDLTTVILIGAVIVLVMIAGVMLYLVRERLLGGDAEDSPGPGGILESMRGMRDRGEISEEEYRAAQAAIVAKASATEVIGPESRRATPSKTQVFVENVGELRAAPGFDLTGERLPPAARRASEESGGAFDQVEFD